MTDQPHDPQTPGTESAAAPSKDERTMAMIAHLLGIVFGFLGPLIIWIIKKEDSDFVDDQGKEALNFQITILIAALISSALTFVLIGCVLIPIVLIVDLVLCIMAAMKANEGVRYRYPFALRLIK